MFKSIYYIHFMDELEFKGTYTQKKLCTHPNMNMRHVLNVNSNSLFKYGRYRDAVTMRRSCAEYLHL